MEQIRRVFEGYLGDPDMEVRQPSCSGDGRDDRLTSTEPNSERQGGSVRLNP